MLTNHKQGFGVWITGLPASGKSTVTKALKDLLATHDIDAAVLESDVLRRVFTPDATYDDADRDLFYRQMAFVGVLLTQHGVPVIFDATANRRAYRDAARREIPSFLEVYVDSAIAICMARDPKGIYRRHHEGKTILIPGLQAPYEPPESPDVIVRGDQDDPNNAAKCILSKLLERGFL